MQCRLQPGAATDRIARPGWKWYSGFFSTGSTAAETMRPYNSSSIRPARLAREAQGPSWPWRSRQAIGHRSQATWPLGEGRQNAASGFMVFPRVRGWQGRRSGRRPAGPPDGTATAGCGETGSELLVGDGRQIGKRQLGVGGGRRRTRSGSPLPAGDSGRPVVPGADGLADVAAEEDAPSLFPRPSGPRPAVRWSRWTGRPGVDPALGSDGPGRTGLDAAGAGAAGAQVGFGRRAAGGESRAEQGRSGRARSPAAAPRSPDSSGPRPGTGPSPGLSWIRQVFLPRKPSPASQAYSRSR